MVFVDTSVWIAHFREGNARLADLLEAGEVFCHRFVIGELACGNLKNRREILSNLELLPKSAESQHEEIMSFIDGNNLMGHGLGYIDIALLTSAMLTNVPIWTLDKRLARAAFNIGIGFSGMKKS